MKIRYAVRVFAFNDNRVVCIKYKNINKGYYDIPGGKIEAGETEIQACIREFKEETGMIADNLQYVGTVKTVYPDQDKIFAIKVYIAKRIEGNPLSLIENNAYWLPINELLNKKKRFAITHLLDNNLIEYFKTSDFNISFVCDNNHNITELKINDVLDN